MRGHEFGADRAGAGEVVDVDFEEMLEGFVGEIASFGGLLIEVEVKLEQVDQLGAGGAVGG